MTNLEIIKYLAANNPARLAELLEDIYCLAWNDGAWDRVCDESSIPSFEKWIYEDAAESGVYHDYELAQWFKAINTLHTVNQAIDEIHLLENIIESEKHPKSAYNNFRDEVCAECPNPDCMKSQIDIIGCMKFSGYTNI